MLRKATFVDSYNETRKKDEREKKI